EWDKAYADYHGRESAAAKRNSLVEAVTYLLSFAETAISPKLLLSVFTRDWIDVAYKQKAQNLQLPHWKNHPVLLKFQRTSLLDRRTEVSTVALKEAVQSGDDARFEKAIAPTILQRARGLLRRAPTCPALFGAR
ncbi:MAG: hypothetical protein AAB250_17915, partial [Bdellovibrionota bacterium]